MRDAEAAADQPRPGEDGLDLLRSGFRGDVEILRGPAEQEVTDATPD